MSERQCRAAFSQVDITPDFQVELIGCDRADSRSQGVLHLIYAQLLLLEYRDTYYCLIAIDSLGLTTALSGQLRSMVAEQLKTDVSQVMINFSHTHSAPAPLSPVNGDRYMQLMRDRILKCVTDTKENLYPCQAGWALTHTLIGENRREGCTTVDDRLGALKIADDTDRLIAVTLRITSHANILMRKNNKISSDFFGAARDKLSKYFDCPVMLVQGAAGNIKPVGVDEILGGSLDDVERVSDMLLDSAKQLRFEMDTIQDLQMYSRYLEYYSDVPDEAEAARIAGDAHCLFGIDGADWLEECERLRQSGVSTQVQTGEVQFFCLNDGFLIGLPDEIFCEIALKASESAHTPYLFLNGYTNGCTGYLPHREEWVKGGYETLYSYLLFYMYHGHVLPFQEDTADRLVRLVTAEWEHSGN